MTGFKPEFYVYNARVASLAAAANALATINIQSDADFAVQKLAFFADLAGAVQTEDSRVIPLVTIDIVDNGSGRHFSDIPVPINSVAGTGSYPFIMPAPRIFVASCTVTVTFTNFSAATTYLNLTLSFIGHKLYRARP